MENAQVADILAEIADLLELQEANPFRVRSYRNAARTVRGQTDRLAEMEPDALADLPNVGDSTAGKIREILDTGTCARLEELRRQTPEGLTEIMRVPGLGPRKAMQLHRRLGVSGMGELAEACENHRVRELEGFGETTERNILAGIGVASAMRGRMLYHDAADNVATLGRQLDDADAVERWVVAGSFRRGKETVGDLDVLVRADDREAAAEQIAGFEGVADVDSRGKEKVTVRLENGLRVDFRFFEDANFGAAIMYFTGSKAHNIALRRRAQQRHWKLSEYGLFRGDRLLAGATEQAVYKKLSIPWIAPELREDRGEIDAAVEGNLPRLIEPGQVRGDLQSHTTASDGVAGVEEMAEAARRRGLSYLAITDHSKRVTMANGLDEDECRRHADAIREIDASIEGLWLMAGIEVDILKDGRLDLDEDVLAELDWVVASVHYDREMPEKAMTDRLVAAVSSGVVHCLGHPLGRIIGRREPIAVDFDRLVGACVEHDVMLEVNAQPDRLDLPDTYCRAAVEAGATFSIGTDAHKPADLDLAPLAVNVARRGWLTADDVVNTLTSKQLRKRIART